MISVPPSTDDGTTTTESDALYETIVTAVADAKGVSPLDVSPPLYEAIDPDAMQAVLASMQRSPEEPTGRLTFHYSGYEVTVTDDGRISVDPHDQDRQ